MTLPRIRHTYIGWKQFKVRRLFMGWLTSTLWRKS
jgi:hypothetical protein